MKLTEFQLLSGANIPFVQAGLVLHQPTLKQIGIVGQANFFGGCQTWRFTKDNLPRQDRISLSAYSNFDIIMSILKEKDKQVRENTLNALNVLSLFFPDYQISLQEQGIVFKKQQDKHIVDNSNFDILAQLLGEVACLSNDKSEAYKAAGDYSQRIIDKIKAGKAKINQQKKGGNNVSILTRYSSVISIGMNISLAEIMKYTIFQLFDAFKRFQLKQQYDLFIKQKLAGAKNVKQVDNWMKDLYNQKDDLLDNAKAFNKKSKR